MILKIILNSLMPQAKGIIAEIKARFWHRKSSMNRFSFLGSMLKILITLIKPLPLLDRLQKSFWEALQIIMNKYNVYKKLIHFIQQLYDKASNTVMFQGSIKKWFHTSAGVCQICLLSSMFFNVLECIISNTLEEYQDTISIGCCNIINLCFADIIDDQAGKKKLVSLKKLDDSCKKNIPSLKWKRGFQAR